MSETLKSFTEGDSEVALAALEAKRLAELARDRAEGFADAAEEAGGAGALAVAEPILEMTRSARDAADQIKTDVTAMKNVVLEIDTTLPGRVATEVTSQVPPAVAAQVSAYVDPKVAAAEAAKVAAQLAASLAIGAAKPYANTAAGLAAVASGEFFSVIGSGNDAAIVYEKVSAAAVERTRIPASAFVTGVGSRVTPLEAVLPVASSLFANALLATVVRLGAAGSKFRFIWTYLSGANAGKFDTTPASTFIDKVAAGITGLAPSISFTGRWTTTQGLFRREVPFGVKGGPGWYAMLQDRATGLMDVMQTRASRARNSVPVDVAIYAPERFREVRRRLMQRARGRNEIIVVALSAADSWGGASGNIAEPVTKVYQAQYGDGGRGWVAFAFGSTTENQAGDYAGAGCIVDPTSQTTKEDGTLWRSAGWTKSFTAPSPDGGAVMSSTPGSYFEWSAVAGQNYFALFITSGTVKYAFDTGSGYGAFTQIAITPNGLPQRYALSGVPQNQKWKVRIEVVSGDVMMHGGDQRTGLPGFVFHKLAKGGTHSGTWANLIDRAAYIEGMRLLGIHGNINLLGTNDKWNNGTDAIENTPAVYKTNGAEIIARQQLGCPGMDVAMMVSPETRKLKGIPISEYRDAWMDLAREKRVTCVDLGAYYGEDQDEYGFGSSRGYLDVSLIHPSTSGSYVNTRAFMDLMSFPEIVEGVVSP